MFDKPIDVNIHSDTVDKALDIAKPSLQKTLDKVSDGLTKCMDLFGAIVGPHMDKYIMEYPYKKDALQKEIEQKYNAIPEEYRTDPKINIAGPVFENLKYNLDEEHIKELFTNILISDMDSRKQSKVLPSYVEIVRQLSQADAEYLNILKAKINMHDLVCEAPIIKLKYTLSTGGFIPASNDIVLIYDNTNYFVLPSIVIDNLSRLQIIDIDFSKFKVDETKYKTVFNKISEMDDFKNIPFYATKLDYFKGILTITDFGKPFLEICLS